MNNEHQRGLADESAEPRFLVIGRVTKPHGIRGEVRVEVHTDDPQRYSLLDRLYLDDKSSEPIEIEHVRYHKTWVLLKLKGIDDRASAESLRSKWLQIPEEEALPLDDGQYYLYQIIGVKVYVESGDFLGDIIEVLETKANNVFLVKGDKGEILLPDIAEVVKEINLEQRTMIVRLLPGLI
jgi:16S rRNA processing protein RimM